MISILNLLDLPGTALTSPQTMLLPLSALRTPWLVGLARFDGASTCTIDIDLGELVAGSEWSVIGVMGMSKDMVSYRVRVWSGPSTGSLTLRSDVSSGGLLDCGPYAIVPMPSAYADRYIRITIDNVPLPEAAGGSRRTWFDLRRLWIGQIAWQAPEGWDGNWNLKISDTGRVELSDSLTPSVTQGSRGRVWAANRTLLTGLQATGNGLAKSFLDIALQAGITREVLFSLRNGLSSGYQEYYRATAYGRFSRLPEISADGEWRTVQCEVSEVPSA
jgi:hypothetical protein